MPNISVCMATFNGEKYIYEQLKSILNQLEPTDEIIISDDSSTDKLISIIKDFNDDRIKLFEGQKFADHIRNFEFALSQATGDYIFLADQDDIWMPDKVKTVMAYLQKTELIMSDCTLIDKHGNTIKESFFEHRKSKKGLIKNFYKNTYTGCCMAFNRNVLLKTLPFPKKIVSHDNWIGLVAETICNPIFIKQPLIKLRRHGENVSAQSGTDTFLTLKTTYGLFDIFANRTYLLYHLVKRFVRNKLNKQDV